MTLWRDHFTGITWSGGAFGSGDMSQNDAPAEEVCLYLVWYHLTQDAVLSRVFTPSGQSDPERIETMEIRNPTEFRNLPRLQVYMGSLTEDQVPTQLDVAEIGVYVGLRWDLNENIARLQPGEPTQATVMRRVKEVLKDKKQLVTQINGSGTALAVGGSHQEGPVNYLIDVDQTGDRFTLTQEVLWTYEVDIDFKTSKIANLLKAGGS